MSSSGATTTKMTMSSSGAIGLVMSQNQSSTNSNTIVICKSAMPQQNYNKMTTLSSGAIKQLQLLTATPKQSVNPTAGCANNNTMVKYKGITQQQQKKAIL